MPLLRARLSLTQRIFGLLIIGFGFAAALFSYLSEGLLESAILEQTKQQARVFLLGLEQQIQRTGYGLDPAAVTEVLEDGAATAQQMGFVLHRLYVYDPEGQIIAQVGGRAERLSTADMAGHYGEVLRLNRAYLGNDVESFVDPDTGKEVPKVDLILPLHLEERVAGGIEAELNLEQTLVLVRTLDNQYENRFLLALAVTGVLTLGVFWIVIRGHLIVPVQRLGKVTHDIAAGNLGSRATDLSRDELGELGESVNLMASSIEKLMEEHERAYLQALQSLAKALEAKDSYTAKHSARVARFSVMLGRRLGLPEEEIKLLKQGALMHDLGKIGIPDAILNKPEALTDEEYETMRNHPVATAEIMRPLKHFREFVDIAAWHHERWDGRGYPDGLSGESIPLLARIVSIADTWDAMTGDRIYRRGMSVEAALAILESEKDSGQWDPQLVSVFIDMVRALENNRRTVEEDADSAGPTYSIT